MNKVLQRILIGGLRVYKAALSPWLGPHCRFHPSCSVYAMEALHCHGVGKGLWLATRRLLRCHPWNPGGFDPVPGTLSEECR
jgi:uncharacterized protein